MTPINCASGGSPEPITSEGFKGFHQWFTETSINMSDVAMSSNAPISKRSESLLNDKWDVVISNTLVKTGLGFGAGVLASVLLFRRRQFPVWLGIGFGAGRGYAEGDAIFRETHAGVRTVRA